MGYLLMTGKRSTDGFSLLEITVVLTISTILISLATPAYHHLMAAGYRRQAQMGLLNTALAASDYQHLGSTRAPPSLGALGQPKDLAHQHYIQRLEQNASESMVTARPNQTTDRCQTLAIDTAGHTYAAQKNCWP